MEKLDDEIVEKLRNTDFGRKFKIGDKETIEKLMEAGLPREIAKNTWAVENGSIFVNRTRGIPYLEEARELIAEAFRIAMNKGPLAEEKVRGVMVNLVDAILHEDAIHRGPSQVYPAIYRPIYAGMLYAKSVLLEPIQKLFINIPQQYMGAVTTELQGRRAQIQDINSEGEQIIIIAYAPVSEMIGFTQKMRQITQGRAVWTAEFFGYQKVPPELQDKVIAKIRERKGLPKNVKSPEEYLD